MLPRPLNQPSLTARIDKYNCHQENRENKVRNAQFIKHSLQLLTIIITQADPAWLIQDEIKPLFNQEVENLKGYAAELSTPISAAALERLWQHIINPPPPPHVLPPADNVAPEARRPRRFEDVPPGCLDRVLKYTGYGLVASGLGVLWYGFFTEKAGQVSAQLVLGTAGSITVGAVGACAARDHRREHRNLTHNPTL